MFCGPSYNLWKGTLGTPSQKAAGQIPCCRRNPVWPDAMMIVTKDRRNGTTSPWQRLHAPAASAKQNLLQAEVIEGQGRRAQLKTVFTCAHHA